MTGTPAKVADQMEVPTERLFPLDGIIATIGAVALLPAACGMCPSADRQQQPVFQKEPTEMLIECLHGEQKLSAVTG